MDTLVSIVFLLICGVIALFSWAAKKKQEEEARTRDQLRRDGRKPAPPPKKSAATDLEAFLERLSGKEEPEARPPEEPDRREEPAREERAREAPPRPRVGREEPRQAPVRQIARAAARSVERAGLEAQRGPSPFEDRRREIEGRIAAARKEAEDAAEHVRAAQKDITLAAATVAGADVPRLPAAALTGGQLNRESLRRAIVMMEILGRPRGLRDYDLPY